MTKSNPYDEDTDKAAELLRLTVSFLNQHKIPHSPLNYRLGYDVASGRNEELKAALEELLTQTDTLPEDSLWQLYQQFFDQDATVVEAIRNELKNNITSLQSEFENAEGDLSSYAKSLSTFIKVLDSSSPCEKVLSEVQKVIEDTRLMEQSQLRLESQIADVLAEVNVLRQELGQVKQETL